MLRMFGEKVTVHIMKAAPKRPPSNKLEGAQLHSERLSQPLPASQAEHQGADMNWAPAMKMRPKRKAKLCLK